MLAPLWYKLGPKIAIIRGFTDFFQNYWIAAEVINID